VIARTPGARAYARSRPGVLFAALVMLLAGCAAPQAARLRATAAAFPQPVELRAVPFFPQDDYQCGPASLAMVLNAAGVVVTSEALTPQVYLPARHGSLQAEILAAARRHGRIAYVLRPELESVFAELAAGNPVLVLQNLALDWQPQWHYAVIIGFDLPRNELVLRSGVEARLVTSIDVFERTWARGEHWAVVVLPPARLPFTAEELPYLKSVAALERLGLHAHTAEAYGAALKRWPKSFGAHVGLGNSRYALGDLAGAEAAFRQALSYHPQVGAAHNNLAQTLADQGRLADAEAAAARAVALEPHNALFRATLADIRRRRHPQTQSGLGRDA
jgi:hypothetical protein